MASPPAEKIDVVLCTLNSNKPYFEKCLRSIAREIPVHDLIIVDSFSSDGTLDTVKKYFNNTVIIQKRTDLAHKRMLGIGRVDTDIFAFVDDDIVLSNGWFKKLVRCLQENDVGAVQGMALPSYTIFRGLRYAAKKVAFRKTDPETFRGETHNTLIRTELVKDWRPLFPVAAEDVMLKRHILNKGKQWIFDGSVVVLHYVFDEKPTLRKQFRRTSWGGANLRVVGFWRSTRKRILQCGYSILQDLVLGVTSKNPRLFVYKAVASIGYLNGYLRWNKYLKQEAG